MLVGEAPGPSVVRLRRPGEALTGAAGRRLAALAGVPLVTYLRRTERVNLLDAYPGERWPSAEARDRARSLLPRLAGRTTLLAGRRVAAAFGVDAPWYEWVELDGGRVAVLPHPSGRSRYWNDPANRDAAAEFLRAALNRAIPIDRLAAVG